MVSGQMQVIQEKWQGWEKTLREETARACLIVCVSVFCLKGLMHDE